MIKILKSIGNGTAHEYSGDLIIKSLPSRRGEIINFSTSLDEKRIENIWYDKLGIRYSLIENVLIIENKDFFPETIVEYINSIPDALNLNIVMKINTRANEVAGFNMLCDTLSSVSTKRNIILDMSDLKFGDGVAFDVERLPFNVKITNVINNNSKKEEKYFWGENSLDWWLLNCNDEKFGFFYSKLTNKAQIRAAELRKIALNFYRFVPNSIKHSNNIRVKSDFVYEWCCKTIEYDNEGTLSDGSFNYNRRDTQDPIVTFYRRKGVCAGRARLLKVLLNNYYMHCPCFLIRGMAGGLQHEWNEVIDEQGVSIDYDISKSENNHHDLHDDYELSKFYLKNRLGGKANKF